MDKNDNVYLTVNVDNLTLDEAQILHKKFVMLLRDRDYHVSYGRSLELDEEA